MLSRLLVIVGLGLTGCQGMGGFQDVCGNKDELVKAANLVQGLAKGATTIAILSNKPTKEELVTWKNIGIGIRAIAAGEPDRLLKLEAVIDEVINTNVKDVQKRGVYRLVINSVFTIASTYANPQQGDLDCYQTLIVAAANGYISEIEIVANGMPLKITRTPKK